MANPIVSGVYSCINSSYALYETLKPKNREDVLILGLTAGLCFSGDRVLALIGATYYIGVNLKAMYVSNNVYTIYVPPERPKQFIKANEQKIIDLHARKDVQLVQKGDKQKKLPWSVLGVTSIPSRDNQTKCPVYIKSLTIEKDGHTRTQFSLHNMANDEVIGHATFRFCDRSNNFCNEFFPIEKPLAYTGYGFDKVDVDKIVLENIENKNPEKYKNVGVVLLKAILQCYVKYDCRVSLDAVCHSHAYFYKLGFRVSDTSKQHLNRTFAEMAASKEISTKDNGSFVMHLPTRARELWQNETKINPIFFYEP